MKYLANQLQRDEFGRVNGIIAVNKPAGFTSHDVVAKARGALKTKKVGHAGALDPFATGILILLVGKATKMSDDFVNYDKEYIANTLFGISTDSSDTEGRITDVIESPNIDELPQVLEQFTPSYEQFVSVYSSVKVDGNKLRVLARSYENFDVEDRDEKRFAKFYNDVEDKPFEVELPKHLCKIPEIEILNTTETDISDIKFYEERKSQIPTTKFPTATIRVACSKGTYIRALAEDIGQAFPTPIPAMLIGLERTKVGDITLDKAVEIDELENL